MAMTGDQSKSLGVLKDSYIKKHGCNPVTLALYYNNTTGEKINLKFKKVTKSEENELKDNNTCINSLHRGTMDEDIVKEQTKHPSDTQTPMVLPGILPNNHNCRLKKTPHMARPALNKHNKEFKNNRFADYETMLLKIIADLMTETEADLVKKHSGFCILNGLVVKSEVNIKDENIIVVNSKLAKEGGVLLDIPAEMINFCQINKNSKAISKLNIDEIKANIIIKPLTLVVGDSIIKIRICNKILVNGNDDIQNGGLLTEPRLNYKNNASTQTDYSISNVVDDKSESTINSIPVLSEILDKTRINTSEINFAIDEPSLTKSNESNEQSSENLLIGTSIKLKSNKLLNYNKNNLEHVKCKRLHNVTRSVLNEKNKTQVINICEKLIKQCKLLQMRNELNIGTNFKAMCSFSHTKFTTKNPKKLFKENEIRNYPSYTIISTQNHKFGSDEMGKNSINTNINHKNNIKFTNNVKEGINIKENDVSNKENIVMFNEIYKKHGDSEDVNTGYTMQIEDQHEVDMFGNKAKLFSNASKMTESEIVKNDIKVIPVKCIHNKSNLSSYSNRKTPKLCRRLKRHEIKHKIGIKKYLAQEINKFKKDFQKYDVSNDKIVRKQKIVDQISISQNSVCKTRSLKSDHKMGESSSTILIPMLSDPLDEIHNKFTLFGNPGGQFKHSTNFIEKIESQLEYSDSCYLTDYSSNMFSKPMVQKRIGSSMQEFSDTSTSVYSASDVKVACDKCNKLCEVTVNKELGQLKLQLKSHICLVNSNQIQRFSREEQCSKNDNNETFSSKSENSHLNPLFEKNINILTKLPMYSKLIVPMNTHSENLKSNDSLQNKFIETSNSSFSTLPKSVRSSDKTDSKSKLTYKKNSSMEVFSNTQNRNFSSQSTDKKQEGLEDSVQIECEQCGKLRTLNISKKNGNTILELISHVCLVDKNKGCGDLDKLTRKLIPLNQSALTSLDKNSDLEVQSEVVTNIVNYCSNVHDNNICSQENKAKSNPFSNLVDRKNSTDIPLENNLSKSKILESTTWERFLNQTGVRNSDELLIQIQNCIKTHLQIVGTSGCTIDSEHNKNYTTESISTSRYNADNYRSDKKDLNEEMRKEKPVENELLNQNDLIIKTDVKENITTNEIENNFLQNSHFDVVTVFNREEFEDSSSHNVFNQGIKPKSVLYFNDNMKTDKDQEMKNCLNGIADISSAVRVKTLILNPNETSMKKNIVENGESVIKVLKIYNRENISDNQYKLQNTNRLNGRENIKGIILDEPVPSPRYRESGLKSKPLKCKKKLKVKDSLCVIL